MCCAAHDQQSAEKPSPWRNARGARGGKPVRVARLTPVRRCVDAVVDEFRRLCRPKVRDVTRDAISEILKYSVFVKYLRYLGSARAWQTKLYDGRRRSSFSRDRSLEKRTRRASHQQRTLVYVWVGSHRASTHPRTAVSRVTSLSRANVVAAVVVLTHRRVLVFNTKDTDEHPSLRWHTVSYLSPLTDPPSPPPSVSAHYYGLTH